MSRWLLLAAAIIAEVTGTLALRAAIEQPLWTILVVCAYAAAFTLLGLALRTGMPVGVAYGIWGATGVALVAVLAMAIFGEVLGAGDLLGIAVIIAGVALIESGSRPATSQPVPEVRQ